MREIELKAVVDDLEGRRSRLLLRGGVVEFVGRLEDRRYDTPDRRLENGGRVLRLRRYRREGDTDVMSLDWKGVASVDGGYRSREELSVAVDNWGGMARVLAGLGYVVTRAIDRHIEVYRVGGATVRFERYPRMDTLVEVEGSPSAIEAAIVILGMTRTAFTTESLATFVARFEARTGLTGVVDDAGAALIAGETDVGSAAAAAP